jgi:transposase
MARKNYSEEFRRQAVDLYESTPGATLKGIAADLGVVRGTLAQWVDLYGTGKTTAPDGTTTTRPVSSHGSGSQPPPGPETPEQKIARLEAENAALRADKTKLTTEREILRQAAKYFAGETNW